MRKMRDQALDEVKQQAVDNLTTGEVKGRQKQDLIQMIKEVQRAFKVKKSDSKLTALMSALEEWRKARGAITKMKKEDLEKANARLVGVRRFVEDAKEIFRERKAKRKQKRAGFGKDVQVHIPELTK